LCEGSFVRNVVVQILKFDAKPNPKRGNSYGNVSGWLGVRHTPVLYQNG